MRVRFERNALYEEVWNTPLSKLGPKYGLSDNGLRKICKTLEVPVPERGHWAKLEAGKPVERAPLPAEAETQTYTTYVPDRANPEHQRPEDQTWLAQRLAYDEMPNNAVSYEVAPRRWHALLVPIRNKLVLSAKEHEKWVTERRREASKVSKRKAAPSLHPLQEYFNRRDGGLLVPRHWATGVKVSALTLERALAIVNALLFAAEARGCTVSLDDERGRFVMHLESAVLRFSIRERQETSVDERGYRTYISTNKLALMIDRLGTEFEILDRENAPVESRLMEVFPRLYREVVTARESERAEAARKLRSAAWAAEQDILEKARKERDAAMAVAAARRSELFDEAESWRKAQAIREYVAAVAAHSTEARAATDHLLEWQLWALITADELDPVERRLKGLAAE